MLDIQTSIIYIYTIRSYQQHRKGERVMETKTSQVRITFVHRVSGKVTAKVVSSFSVASATPPEIEASVKRSDSNILTAAFIK